MSTPTTETEPRRQTPSERQHQALLAALERAPSAASKPSFHVSRTKAGAEQSKTGTYEFYEFEAHIPVCDEFPTAQDAFDALLRFKRAFSEEISA